jgi:apolipoprotein N-acyltransferase
MTSLAQRLAGHVSSRPRLSALAAGVVSTLALPPLFFGPVLFLTLPALVLAIDVSLGNGRGTERPQWPELRRAGLIGWLFGFGYFVTSLYWMSASLFVEPEKFIWLVPFSATLIPAGLALFWAGAVMGAASMWRPGVARVVALAICLTMAEWLRGHVLTGLPWNTIGYVLTAPGGHMQLASLCGVYGLSLVAVLTFALPVCLLDRAEDRSAGLRWMLPLLLPLAFLVAAWGWGAQRASAPNAAPMAGVKLRILQPNISQNAKWRSENRRAIFESYLAQSRRGADGRDDALAGITHLIWPESAIPFLLLDTPEALQAVAALLPAGTHLVTGAIRVVHPPPNPSGSNARRRIYNAIIALDDEARLVAVYDKLHLVPFGEFLPLQRVLEAIGLEQLTRIQGGFDAGGEPVRLMRVAGLPPLSPLVCYESIFPDEVVTPGNRPGFFLNVTNDGWFGRTAGPHQHFHQARIRAVEQGLPLVRAANTGISAVVDGHGRILFQLGLGKSGVIDSALPTALPPTLYAHAGEWSTVVLLALAFLTWLALLRRQQVAGKI